MYRPHIVPQKRKHAPIVYTSPSSVIYAISLWQWIQINARFLKNVMLGIQCLWKKCVTGGPIASHICSCNLCCRRYVHHWGYKHVVTASYTAFTLNLYPLFSENLSRTSSNCANGVDVVAAVCSLFTNYMYMKRIGRDWSKLVFQNFDSTQNFRASLPFCK